jgi:hypothetical protein
MDEITLLHAAQDAVRRRPPVMPENGGTQIIFPIVAQIMERLGQRRQDGPAWRKVYSKRKPAEPPQVIPEVEEIATELLGAPIVGQAAASPSVEFPQIIDPPAPGWSGDYLDAIIQAQEIMDKHETEQTKVPIVVPENLPYGVVFSGDWHMGGRGVDHKLLREYFSLWKRTPGLGVVGMGDYTEMFTGKMAGIGVKEHAVPPDMQIALAVDQIQTELSDCLIALLKGNHDNWAGNYANYVQLLAQRIRPKGKDKPGIPYLGVGGEIMLTVGRTEYKIAAWHRYPGAGAINKGNNQRRVSVDHNGPDVVALAHLHYQYGELSRNGETDQVRCRSGAMKIRDEHSRDYAGNITPDTRMPCVIFHPTRKSMMYYADFREAIEPLLYYRSRWARRPDWSTDSKSLDELLSQFGKPA